MEVTLAATVTHLCPYVDEVDVGTVTVTYSLDPSDEAIELHDLAAFLGSFHATRTTHEALTSQIADRYPSAVVVSKWVTAGIEVECRAVPRDRVGPAGA